VIDSIVIKSYLRRLRNRVVVANYFHGAAVARALALNHDDAVRGLLFGAKPRQSNC
jgi:hypothetical protein